MPFSQEIMDSVVPANTVVVKASFTGVEDLEAHLTAFHTQMMLSGGSDAVYCKVFMSTLSGTALDWFVSIPTGHITTFQQFSKMFVEQYILNKAPPLVSYDLFDIRQYQGESLKDFLNRFGAQIVCLPGKDEEMFVHAFKKGVLWLMFGSSGATPPSSPKSGDVLWLTSPPRARSPRREEMWPQLNRAPKQGYNLRG